MSTIMWKILVILTGILNQQQANVTLNSQFTYPTKEICMEAQESSRVVADVKNYAGLLKQLGYSDISIDKFSCEQVGNEI